MLCHVRIDSRHAAWRKVQSRFLWRGDDLVVDSITTETAFVFRRNFAGIILESDFTELAQLNWIHWSQHTSPIGRRWYNWRRLDLGIYKVQSHSPLAHSARLSTILAIWKSLIALQMPLSASQASSAYSFRLVRGSDCRCFHSGHAGASGRICCHLRIVFCRYSCARLDRSLLGRGLSYFTRPWVDVFDGGVVIWAVWLVPNQRQIRYR